MEEKNVIITQNKLKLYFTLSINTYWIITRISSIKSQQYNNNIFEAYNSDSIICQKADLNLNVHYTDRKDMLIFILISN